MTSRRASATRVELLLDWLPGRSTIPITDPGRPLPEYHAVIGHTDHLGAQSRSRSLIIGQRWDTKRFIGAIEGGMADGREWRSGWLFVVSRRCATRSMLRTHLLRDGDLCCQSDLKEPSSGCRRSPPKADAERLPALYICRRPDAAKSAK